LLLQFAVQTPPHRVDTHRPGCQGVRHPLYSGDGVGLELDRAPCCCPWPGGRWGVHCSQKPRQIGCVLAVISLLSSPPEAKTELVTQL